MIGDGRDRSELGRIPRDLVTVMGGSLEGFGLHGLVRGEVLELEPCTAQMQHFQDPALRVDRNSTHCLSARYIVLYRDGGQVKYAGEVPNANAVWPPLEKDICFVRPSRVPLFLSTTLWRDPEEMCYTQTLGEAACMALRMGALTPLVVGGGVLNCGNRPP